MPKIIENLPQRLMEEARTQVQRSGYGAMTIRSVAAACGVGVGTVYNYYASKDALVAAFLLEDWKACLDAIARCAETAETAEPVLHTTYSCLQEFLSVHAPIFRDEAAAAGFSGSVGKYHSLLRSQLAAPLERFCEKPFQALFIAEAMLTWTVAGIPYPQLWSVIQKLF